MRADEDDDGCRYADGPPVVFWISGFFFTPSFCTALLQNYVRARKLAIDSVTFDVQAQCMSPASVSVRPSEGAYVHGLLLEGAGWDAEARQLRESRPRVLIESAPVLWLRPCRVEDMPVQPSYSCPVYRTGERRGVLATTGHDSNFLMVITMPSDLPEWHWTLRGVCMLTSASD